MDEYMKIKLMTKKEYRDMPHEGDVLTYGWIKRTGVYRGGKLLIGWFKPRLRKLPKKCYKNNKLIKIPKFK